MIAEDKVSVSSRYLNLYTRVSKERFSREREVALNWCSKNRERLTESNLKALKDLQTFDLSHDACAFVIERCYADIPPGRKYQVIFDLSNPLASTNTTASLRFSIFWRKLPTLSLDHGHHYLAVFDFPVGVPEIVNTLPVDLFDGGLAGSRLGLCDSPTWNQICQGR